MHPFSLSPSSAWYCLCFSLQEFPTLASVRNQIWRHHGGPALNMQGSPSHDKTDACNPTARSGSGPCCAFHISSPSSRSSSFAALSLSRKGSKFGDLSRAAAAGMYTESPTRGAPNAANCARICRNETYVILISVKLWNHLEGITILTCSIKCSTYTTFYCIIDFFKWFLSGVLASPLALHQEYRKSPDSKHTNCVWRKVWKSPEFKVLLTSFFCSETATGDTPAITWEFYDHHVLKGSSITELWRHGDMLHYLMCATC